MGCLWSRCRHQPRDVWYIRSLAAFAQFHNGDVTAAQIAGGMTNANRLAFILAHWPAAAAAAAAPPFVPAAAAAGAVAAGAAAPGDPAAQPAAPQADDVVEHNVANILTKGRTNIHVSISRVLAYTKRGPFLDGVGYLSIYIYVKVRFFG